MYMHSDIINNIYLAVMLVALVGRKSKCLIEIQHPGNVTNHWEITNHLAMTLNMQKLYTLLLTSDDCSALKIRH